MLNAPNKFKDAEDAKKTDEGFSTMLFLPSFASSALPLRPLRPDVRFK
jgi:hypothetical protein